MAIQSSFYTGTALDSRTFPSTKHIATKQHMAVWRQQVSDDVWVQMDISLYQLINNACVLNSLLDTTTYDQLEVRVADTPDELTTAPSDIAIVAGIASEIVIVAGIEAEVIVVAGDSAVIQTTAGDTVAINIVAGDTTALNIVAGDTVALNLVADDLAKGIGTNQPTDSAILNALTNANQTIADVVLTHADVVITNGDVVITNGDVVLTNADVVITNGDVVLTNADVVSTQLFEWEAEAEALTADSYATEAEDVVVNIVTSDGDGTFTYTPQTGVYSALHWAAKASANSTQTVHIDGSGLDNEFSTLSAMYKTTATGDGVTNDYTALATDITTANTLGLPLYLPKGTYLIGGGLGLTLPDNFDLIMHSGAKLFRDTESSTPVITTGNYCNIQGGQITTDASYTITSNTNCAIRVFGKNVVGIEDVYIEGEFYVGINFDGATNSNISDCYVKGVKNRSYYFYQLCENILVNNCIANGKNSVETAFTQYGFNSNAGGVGEIYGIQISNCNVKYTTLQGFEFGDVTGASGLTNCTAKAVASGHGFLVQFANGSAATRIYLSGCTAINCQNGFLFLDVQNVVASSCIAYSNSGSGFIMNDTLYFSLSACQSNSNTLDGFNMTGACSRSSIVGCNAISNLQNGYNIETGQSRMLISSNIGYANSVNNFLDNGSLTVNANNIFT